MKKVLCFLLSVILISLFIAPSVSVHAEENTDESEFKNAVSFTCTYQAKENRIYIDGTVAHDFLMSHKDYKITLYRILPGQTLESAMSDEQCIVTERTDMTVKFTFYVNVDSILERFSKYAIVLISPTNESYLAGQPLVPSVSSSYEYDMYDKSGFKGICSDNSLHVGDSGAGTVIVDVDISNTRGDSAISILYPMGDTYVHFNKSYISSIDKQFRSALTNNAKVYIRLLLPAKDTSLSIAADDKYLYSIPNLYSKDVIEYVFTLAEFLTQRYDGITGQLYGIIAGSKIDDIKKTTCIGERDIYEYAELYTLYLTVIANAARALNKELDIVIPVSDINSYNSNSFADNEIRASELIEQIIYRLDKNVSGNFDCTLLVESNTASIYLKQENGKSLFTPLNSDNLISPYNIDSLLSYIRDMKRIYKSSPSNVIYLWNVEETLEGNSLASAYAYSYMQLLTKKDVSSFVIHSNSSIYSDLATVMRHIDTEDAIQMLEPLCKYFGANKWDEILQSTPNLPILHKIFEVNMSAVAPTNTIGKFQYMDFSASAVYPLIHEGQNCEYIRSDYDKSGNRILRVGSSKLARGDSIELMGIFEYSESYIYTPTLSFEIGVEDTHASEDAVYEITATIGTSNTRLTAIGTLKNGETKSLYFKISKFAAVAEADYIRISARCLTEESNALSLLLGDINGYSNQHDTEALSELIKNKRQQIRDQGVDNDNAFDYTMLITIISVATVAVVLAVILLIPLKRNDDTDRE